MHAEGGGSEGTEALPDETAISAQSQEARAGGAQALMNNAAEGSDAENCVCIGEIDGKPWMVKDVRPWPTCFLFLLLLSHAQSCDECVESLR